MTETAAGASSAVALAAAGRTSAATTPGAPPHDLPDSPYKGLSHYSEQDAPFFFGRKRETQVVIANFMASRLTLIYGESGVGKSSLLRAGVSRQLREMALDDIRRHRKPQFVVAIFPPEDDEGTRVSWRDDPVGGIALAIERAVSSLGVDVEPPARGLRLAELLAQWTERLDCHLLLILDQFEEYLLYHEGEEGEGTLAGELPAAVAQAALRVSFLISIREDAYAKLDRFKGRITVLFDSYLRVKHLDRKGAEDAIVKPVEKYNELSGGQPKYSIEPKLVDALVKELETGRVVVGDVGAGAAAPRAGSSAAASVETPYLQLVMTRLWKEELRAGSTELQLTTLERLGHAEVIVKTHLDEIMARLPQHAQDVAAQLFHHLITPSGSKIAHSASDLAEYIGVDETEVETEVEPVLELLASGEYRILRVVASQRDDEPSRYEIFHDVLGAAILDWRAGYVAGQREAEQRRAEWARLRARFRNVVAGLLVVAAVSTASLAVFAWIQRSDARREATEARALSLAATSEVQRTNRLDLALLLGLEAYGLSERPEVRSSMIGALTAAGRAGVRSPLVTGTRPIRSIAVSPDGRTLATTHADGTRLWATARRGSSGQLLRGQAGGVNGVAFSSDGRTLATAGDDETVQLWDAARLRSLGRPLLGHIGAVHAVAFSPNGDILASAGADNTVRLWDTAAGRPLGPPLLGHTGTVRDVAFSPDGRALASASTDLTVRLWDVAARRPLGEPLGGHDEPVTSLAFSPNGRTLATAGADGTVRLWDALARKRLGEPLRGHAASVTAVSFSPGGRTLASASEDGTVRLWTRTGERLGDALRAHKGSVTSLAFAPSGLVLFTGGNHGTVRRWDVGSGKLLGQALRGHDDSVTRVAFSPDGRTLASAGVDEIVQLWDLGARKPVGEPLRGHIFPVLGVAFSPDGRTLATSGDDASVRLWNVRTRKPRGDPLVGHAGGVTAVVFSPDGRMLASASEDGTVRLWNTRARTALGEPLRGHTAPVTGIAFSRDGGTLASASEDGTVRLWDVRARKPVGKPLRGHKTPVTGIAFSSDGRILASSGEDGTVRLSDARTREALGEPLRGHTGRVTGLAFSRDGHTLVTGGEDETVRLWDVGARKPLGEPLRGHRGAVLGVSFSPDGRTVASAGSDRTARLWTVFRWSTFEDLRQHVCRLVGRNLTKDEWTALAPGQPHRASCPA